MKNQLKNERLDVIIVAGQSNSYGCGLGNVDKPYKENQNIYTMYNPNAIVYSKDETGKERAHASFPTKTEITYTTTVRPGENTTSFFPYFAELYEKNNLKEGRKILIIDGGVGGTCFAKKEWGIGDCLHQRLVNMVDEAIAMNAQNRIVAFLWHQGESDVLDYCKHELSLKEFYYNSLKNFLYDIKTKYKNWDFPVISAGFVEEWYLKNKAKCDEIYSAYKELEEENILRFINTKKLKSNNQQVCNGDDIHFCAQAQAILGELYYKEFVCVKNRS